MTSEPEMFDYDVALSYAGEDREYVGQVAAQLQQRDIRIFYDEYAAAQLWGNDLYVLLDEVYRKRARFAVIFISRHYASKPWTHHERQSAQARALTEVDPYLLPVRLDDSELPGLRPTVGYIDARNTSVERLVWLIEQKLAATPGIATSRPPLLRSPRTAEQKRELLAQRPEAWEYLLYAGVLWQQREALEWKWRDHELGYARRSGQYLSDGEAFTLIRTAIYDLSVCPANLLRMLDSRARERAFGPPGLPGDPVLIEHIATRFVEVYEEILDIAARLRGVSVSDNMISVMDAAAHLVDNPLREIRDLIDQVITETDAIPDRMARNEPIAITLTFTLTMDAEAKKHYDREMKRARRKIKR
jgi:TIR domain